MNIKVFPAKFSPFLMAVLAVAGIFSSEQRVRAVPVISNVFPNGAVQFQPSAALTFNVTSSAGIDPGGISVQLTGRSLPGQTLVTTLTTANGLIVGGTSTSRTVSAPLNSNMVYTAGITVIDLSSQSATSNLSFDTIRPAYTFEAEDFDYGGGSFFDNPQTNKYAGLNVTYGVDAQNGNFGGGGSSYRSSGLNTEGVGDKPRSAYSGTGKTDYDVGWNDGGSSKWGNYTRTFPASTFNVFMRAANPNNSTTDSAGLAMVTSGRGTSSQTTTPLGTFSIPNTGDWQAYTWVPALDTNGNLVQFTGGGVKTLRVSTDNGNYNANFYLLIRADTNSPVISQLSPDGSHFFQYTNQLSFTASCSAGISTKSIVVNVDGTSATGLAFSGSTTSWNVICQLSMNTNHTVVITATALNGNATIQTIQINDFPSSVYQLEAEDYDYGSGHFFDNPQTNAYLNRASTSNVDNHQFDLGANPFNYRPNSPAPSTTVANDGPRDQFTVGTDYNIGFFGGGSWVNYTRHYPAGTYYVWGRFAEGAANTEATLSQLISGYGSASQTVNLIGTFFIPPGGWSTWEWALLKDGNGNPVKVRFDDSQNTLQLGGSPVGGQPEVNVNFLMLVPTAPDLFVVSRAINNGMTNVQILYSKPVEAASATNIANYVFTNGLAVTGASLSGDNLTVTLTTAPMTYGTNYSIVINGVRDRMNLPNTIALNTTVTFQAVSYTLQDLGNPPILSSIAEVAGGVNVVASGSDIGGTNDQGAFSYQIVSGNFDVAVRLAGLGLSDIFAKAGLMAREDLTSSARFAASLATPAMNGTFFESRITVGGASSSAGNFPANYPNTWLRLQRVGNVFTGYASYDGQVWTQLGSSTIAMPGQIYLGLSVSSHSTNQVTTAQFRDIANVTNAVVGSEINPHEQLGPSSRTTPLAISEIMYKPADRPDGKNLEFVELYNSNPWFQDISGYTFTCADMHYTFPPNTIISGGAFLVVAAVPADMKSVYGIANVTGPYAGSLKKSEELQLLDEQGAVLLTVPYEDTAPWPVAADGAGHSLVLANPTYGEGDPRAWDISDAVGGSPGQMNPFTPSPLRNVVINEFLAHTDLPEHDYIELYNHSTNSVDISGCILTDDPATNKFVIPNGTILPARGFVSFDDTQFNFGLDAAGEAIYFKNPDQSRVLDAVSFGAQENGVATGRWPDGANDFYRLSAPTPGATNAPILTSDVVINELMYDPITGDDDDQYVELYNRSANPVDMSGWQLADGVSYTIPNGTTLAAGGYLVVARDAAQLISHYPNLNAGNCLGDFSGKLSHSGEHIALTKPVEHNLTNINVTVNDLTYGTGGRWGQWSHAGGSSLELIDAKSDNRLAANWADSDETSKSVWTNIETTGVLDSGVNYESSIAHAQIGLLDAGECLVDNVEVDYNSANYISNFGFESGTTGWSFQGDMSRSSLENTGYNGSGHSLHIRASDALWTGDNSCQVALSNTGLQSGQTVTLRFKARWLHGWPEALLRLNGNWLEAAGALPVPSNLGSPGLPNSVAAANVGPAIYNVTHTPAVPAANMPVVVTLNVNDPGGVQNLALNYRLDPTTSYTSVTMKDDGTSGDAIAGDGVFSATIPGQNAGTLAAFYISATDNLGAGTRFPALLNDGSPVRECLVRFGDGNPGGSFGVYHLWVSQTNSTRWANLGNLSNEGNDGTFVTGNRVIYNMQGRFTGSPYHQNYNTPDGNLCNYKWQFNDDDQLLGATSFNKIHQPGNGAGDDPSLQREQTANLFLRALGVPWLNRRYVVVYVNGNRRGALMEDAQTPGSDLVKEYFPNDDNGWLYKMQPWFEFAPALSGETLSFGNQSWCTLNNYTTTGGVKKTARYRYDYLVRSTPDSASDFNPVYSIVDAANSYGSANYVTNMESVADMENWMRVFAANHAGGNWDSFGAQNGQNLYGYMGTAGTKYSLLMFDFNIVLGGSDSGNASWSPGENLFTVNGADPYLNDIYQTPVFRRMYLRALGELVKGPLNTANSGPLLDAKYNTFTANGLTVEDPNTKLKLWMNQAHDSIVTQIAVEDSSGFIVNQAVVSNTVAIVSGTAPVDAQAIWINGAAYPVTWSSVTAWTTTVPLNHGTNLFSVIGVDSHGVAIPGEAGSTSVYYAGGDTGTPSLPLVFVNEWMADNKHTLIDPADGAFEDWFELYNAGTNSVDLGGYFLTDKLSNKTESQVPDNGHYVIPPHGFLLVWADNTTNWNSLADPDLHVNFALSKGGEAIGLYAPDGTTIDAITFGAQTSDVTQGRYPDGSTNIVFLTTPTPGTSNLYDITPPQLAGLNMSGSQFKLSWQGVVGRSYQLEYKDDLAAPAWTLTGNSIAGNGAMITLTNDMSLSGHRFFRVQVQ